MSIIVEHLETQMRYLFLGSGYAQWASARPNRVLGDLFAKDQSGTSPMCCVCDYGGRIGWLPSDELKVVGVDGQTPGGALLKAESQIDQP